MMWPAFFFPLLLMDDGGMMAAIIICEVVLGNFDRGICNS